MSSNIYRNNATADPIISQIHSMLPNRTQKPSAGQSNSSARPSSAGATRNRTGAFGYSKGNTGSSGLFGQANATFGSNGLFGQSFGNSRPTSAGHSRPSGSAATNATSSNNPLNVQAPYATAGLNMNQVPSQSGSSMPSRPKSAGAVRRDNPQNVVNPNLPPQQQAAPIYYPQVASANGYNVYTSNNPYAQGRPLSANSYTTTPHGGLAPSAYAPGGPTLGANGFPSQVSGVSNGMPSTAPQAVSYSSQSNAPNPAPIVRPQSASSTANKLRKAVEISQQIEVEQTGGNIMKNIGNMNIGELAGLDNDQDEGLDDGLVLGVENIQTDAQNNKDDEEMDGKPIDSRSHPEISMTTPSASLELANGSSMAVDVRNTSLDSFTEENINVGISTVPNQFCTKRDALELKKLLVLSAGTRGGIVPSSSAVMDMYMVGKVVGVGSYGKVRAAWHRLTAAKVAIKTYDKAKMKDPAHWKRVHSEIKIMEQISHPRIARLYEAVETPKRMHLIMECLDGGNLCSYVKAKRRLTEDESKRIFFQILTAIEYLHSLGVSHRDIKLENVLFANEKEIKLIDFGFSTVCQPGKKLKVFCGTPSYMAPEIVRRAEYEGKPVDMWSMGILLYALLCGCFPFRAKAYPDLYRRIARGAFAIPEELSAPVKDLLRQLLTVEVDQRITAHNAMRHPWLQSQLINAPNMDRMRQDITILISDKPADDLDEQVLSELQVFGMSRDEVIRIVLTKTHSSLATLYYLLLDMLVTRRKASSKRSGQNIGPTMTAPINVQSNTTMQRPMSANYAANIASSNNVIKAIPAPMVRTGGSPAVQPQGGQGAVHYENLIQQQVAEQMAQQQQIERQEYRYRPKSASQNRNIMASAAIATGATPLSAYTSAPQGGYSQQRPLSAFAGRR